MLMMPTTMTYDEHVDDNNDEGDDQEDELAAVF